MNYLDRLYPQGKTAYDSRYVWWLAAPDDNEASEEYIEQARASSLFSCAQTLESAQREIHEQNLWCSQLYSNRELAAFDWGTGQLYKASLSPITRTGENITVRVVDTLVSQIAKNCPKPKPQARGANWYARMQMELLDKFLYGTWQCQDVYGKGGQVFRDACIFGVGAMKVTCESGYGDSDDASQGAQVCYERVFPDEILVDQMEMVACGRIRHFYRRRALPIEVVAATYDVAEEELQELANQQSPSSYLDYRPVGAGWVIVIEGYQLGYRGQPGRWMVATQNMVLDEGEWEYDWLPYVFYHYQVPVSGFYSPGVVEQALPYQIRLNEINDVIRDAQDVMARPRILVAEGSNINVMEVDNAVGRFLRYRGIKPEAVTWPAMNAEIYNERERLVRVCLEHFGLSNLASTVTPPPGARFDSSPAFREFNAIQDDRLSDPARRWENFYKELAVRTTQVIEASGEKPTTTWYSGWKNSMAQTIHWEEIEHDLANYMMTMEAVSIYTMSPAAARDELEKQLAMGLISPEEYRLELASPDQQSALHIQAAAARDLARVQSLLEAGDYENPTPEQDLVNGVTRMTLALLNLNEYEDDGKGKVRLEDVKLSFINWITEAKALLKRGTEPTPDPNAMPGQQQAMFSPTMGGPQQVPVPEAAGLAPAGPGAMPNIT
jgi:hypothetical protein